MGNPLHQATTQLPIDQPFDLAASLESGQAHRWAYPKAGDNGWYTGVIRGDLVRIRQTDKAVEFQCAPSSEADMATRLASYFRLDDDIEAIYADINRNDETMAAIVSRYRGLRLLRQEPWECLVSYICSASNNVEGTQRNVEDMSKAFGSKLALDGCQRYTFPSPKELALAGEEKVRELKLGLSARAHNIHRIAESVCDGSLDLEALRSMPGPDAIKALRKRRGIGSRTAHCIALFSLEKLDSFPVDRWVELALVQLYFPEQQTPTSRKLMEWAKGRYGPHTGYASLYLYHWSRRWDWDWDEEEDDDFATAH